MKGVLLNPIKMKLEIGKWKMTSEEIRKWDERDDRKFGKRANQVLGHSTRQSNRCVYKNEQTVGKRWSTKN